MKRTLACLVALVVAAHAAASAAATVVRDDAAVQVVVASPLTRWSSSPDALKRTLRSVSERSVSYFTTDETGKQVRLRGSPLTFQGISDHPVTNEVQRRLRELGTKPVSNAGYFFTVDGPVMVPVDKAPAFFEAERRLFKTSVLAQGDPTTLQDRTSAKRFFGGVLSLAAGVGLADKFGLAMGSHVMLDTNLSQDLVNAVGPYRGVVLPFDVDALNLADAKFVEVRRVTVVDDLVGQVVIVYREEPTTELRQAALIDAIVELTGAKLTVDLVQKARQADLDSRVALWNQCRAEGGCGAKSD